MSYPKTGEEVYVSLNLSNTMLTGLGKGTITREDVSVDYLKKLFAQHGVIVSAKPEYRNIMERVNNTYDLGLEIPEKLKLFQLSEQHRRLVVINVSGLRRSGGSLLSSYTEEEFAETVAFLKKVAFYETHIFKYSRRKGTKAAVMENQIPEELKTKRSDILLKLDKEHRKEYEAVLVGIEQEVLFEEQVTIDGKDWFVGHTKEYVKIAVPAGENLANQLQVVKVSAERAGDLLTGEVR